MKVKTNLKLHISLGSLNHQHNRVERRPIKSNINHLFRPSHHLTKKKRGFQPNKRTNTALNTSISIRSIKKPPMSTRDKVKTSEKRMKRLI
jgi:hypothetical protein